MGVVRRMVEILLGPLVVRRRMPAASGGGVLVVSGKVGGLRYLLKPSREWDPDLLEVARQLVRKGNVVWDVGSNVGLFSKAASFHAGPEGRVFAIEPDRDAIALLDRSCRWRGDNDAPITIVPVVVGEAVGQVQFAIARRARSANAISGFGTTQTGGVAETRVLPCETLDALMERLPPPDLVKIDVEGAELGVLNGGLRMIRKIRPVIHCEVASEASADVTRLLKSHGYGIYDAQDVVRRMFVEVAEATYNTVAVPSERLEALFSCQ